MSKVVVFLVVLVSAQSQSAKYNPGIYISVLCKLNNVSVPPTRMYGFVVQSALASRD